MVPSDEVVIDSIVLPDESGILPLEQGSQPNQHCESVGPLGSTEQHILNTSGKGLEMIRIGSSSFIFRETSASWSSNSWTEGFRINLILSDLHPISLATISQASRSSYPSPILRIVDGFRSTNSALKASIFHWCGASGYWNSKLSLADTTLCLNNMVTLEL